MARNVRIELDHVGMDALLKRKQVQDMCEKIAERIAATAEASDPHHESGSVEYFVHSKVGTGRAFAWVSTRHPMGGYLESKHRMLGKATRSARGGG